MINRIGEATKKILVVDDDELVGIAIKEELGIEGYEVEYCLSGQEAIEIVKSKSFDLIIIDLVMPETDGIETCRAIKKEHPDINLICMTGHFDGLEVVRRYDFLKGGGRVDHLYKPFKEGELKKLVKWYLFYETA